jgi:hypothetical protein
MVKLRVTPDDLTPPAEHIPPQSWVRTPKIVRAEMMTVVRELAEVKQRLEKAEESLRQNSPNSSRSSAKDRPEHKPMPERGPFANTLVSEK